MKCKNCGWGILFEDDDTGVTGGYWYHDKDCPPQGQADGYGNPCTDPEETDKVL